MSRTFKYRLRSPLGGLAADLSARVYFADVSLERIIQIGRGVRLALPPEAMYWKDVAWLSLALSLHSDALSSRCPDGLCIEVTSFAFPLSDYRSEVAGLAMDGWLREEFDVPDLGIRGEFSGETDPYSFFWGGTCDPFSDNNL